MFFFRRRFKKKKNIYSWINTINREYFEVNTKYISSNVLKISVISPVRSTSENADIFNTRGEMFWYLPEKSKFSFYFFREEKKITFFPGHFSSILLG